MKKILTAVVLLCMLFALTGCGCRHAETKLINARPATDVCEGYDGDTVCVKCGDAIVSERLSVFLDTDIGPDCDDTAALAILLQQHVEGKVELLGVTHCTGSPYGLPTIDAFCRLFGVEVPLGTCDDGDFLSDEEHLKYTRAVAETYPHGYGPEVEQPDAAEALIEALSDVPDGSVTFITVGPLNNAARFLTDPVCAELMHRKVNRIVMMAGAFESWEGHVEWNVDMDAEAMRTVVQEWKGVLELYPFEAFSEVLTGKPLKKGKENPLTLSYRLYTDNSMQRPSWDPGTVAGTVLGLDSAFAWSEWGDLTVDEKGITTLTPNPEGRCRYVRLVGKTRQGAAWLDGLIEKSVGTMTR